MKLATLKDRTRDGELVVVSRDLTRYVSARPIATTLQAALDDWEHIAPRLQMLAEQLEVGSVPSSRFHEHDAMSPLPRAYQRVEATAYMHHLDLMAKASGATTPVDQSTVPVVAQGASDGFTGPRDPITGLSEDWGIDLQGEIAVITGDVPLGADHETAAAAIRLLMVGNSVTLRNLSPAELAKGHGAVQSKPGTSFSPVAVTPEELAAAWAGARASVKLKISINGKPLGKLQTGSDMTFDFAALIAHVAKARPLSAGSIISSGVVSNRGADGNPAKPLAAGGPGYATIAEARAVETITSGAPVTPYLKDGDVVRIEICDAHGHSISGAIEQTVGAIS
jgi:fumarylacetoacetate (FAA) hydrolase